MTHTITLIPGDGIGPEVTDAVVRILDGGRRRDRLGTHDAGVLAFERTGQTLPVGAASTRSAATRSRSRGR